MKPENMIQLRRQLEAMKEFERKNFPTPLSETMYWSELFFGIVALGVALVGPGVNVNPVAQAVGYLIGIGALAQGLYVVNRRRTDKRIMIILEAMLSADETAKV